MKVFAPKIAYLLLFGLVTATGMTSCSEPPPLQLSHRHRQAVDTLFMNMADSISKAQDSICELYFDERVASAVDSMLRVRREEEALLRARIPRE